jgi:class 3 adenylate cyclase
VSGVVNGEPERPDHEQRQGSFLGEGRRFELFSEERRRLEDILRSLGGSEQEIRDAIAAGTGGALAFELAIRDRPPLSRAEAAARMGISEEELSRIWQALGFPSLGAEETVPAALVQSLPPALLGPDTLLGERAAIGLLRVVGSATARLAEAVVDTLRVGFETPQLAAGTSYSEVIETYVRVAREVLPQFEDLVATSLRAHLVRVAFGAWAPDEEQAAARRRLFIGFADLVGYTALARTLSARDLTELLESFESVVLDVVSTADGRLVKLIGDGAMVAAESPQAGCEIALALSDRFAALNSTPPVRVGGAWGVVTSRYGDYFGDVVNLAARLVALANPSTVVVDAAVADSCKEWFVFERLPALSVKGFRAPPVTYRLVGRR